MKSYDVSKLVKAVQVILDRNQVSDALLDAGDTDTLSQQEIIESKIAEAARIIETDAPSHLIAGGIHTQDGDIAWKQVGETYVGDMLVPTDFMRLVSIQMEDWERPGKLISEQDAEYQWQSSRWSGVRGCPQKPIVAAVQYADGLHLELYSCKSSDVEIKRMVYLPLPSIEDGQIKFCEKLKDAILYETAFLTCQTLGDTNTAEMMQFTAYKLAEIPMAAPQQTAE